MTYYNDTSQQIIHECKLILIETYKYKIIYYKSTQNRNNAKSLRGSCFMWSYNAEKIDFRNEYMMLNVICFFSLCIANSVSDYILKVSFFLNILPLKIWYINKKKTRYLLWDLFQFIALEKVYWHRLIQWNCIHHWIIFQSGWKPQVLSWVCLEQNRKSMQKFVILDKLFLNINFKELFIYVNSFWNGWT